MAIIDSSNQYRYTGRQPLDAKALVKTFADLTNPATWTVQSSSGKDTVIAYNGMITAVWLDKDENKQLTDKNGIYFLFDNSITGTLTAPDVTKETNWHKIAGDVDLSSIQEIVDDHERRIAAIEDEERVHCYGYRKDFPTEGQQNHMYVASDVHRTYVFINGTYLPIADQFEYTDHDNNSETPEVRIIYGGDAN